MRARAEEALDPGVALFTAGVSEDSYIYQVNPHSDVNAQHISYFALVGKCLAKCVLEGVTTRFSHFTPDLYNALLGKPTPFSVRSPQHARIWITLNS